jgi:hypothetical protein
MGTGSFLEVKRPGRGVDHPSPLALKLKKEQNCTSPPPLGFHVLFLGELYFYLIYIYIYCSVLVTGELVFEACG